MVAWLNTLTFIEQLPFPLLLSTSKYLAFAFTSLGIHILSGLKLIFGILTAQKASIDHQTKGKKMSLDTFIIGTP